jgi:hypothetical protein
MNTEKKDKTVIDLFMDDSLWLKKITKKEKIVEEQKVEEKPEISPPEEAAIKKETIIDEKKLIRENIYEDSATTPASEKGFGEVDYAILKSITYGFKDIKQISKALQIRTLVVEKHVYDLIKEGFLKYFQYAVITSKGKDAIFDFEANNPEDVWKPIDEFIVSVIEYKKERNLKFHKMIDIVLLISMIILIILIIYFGIFS